MTAISQRSFAAGEIAPSLYARVDVDRYATALRTLRNFSTLRSGGVENRAGFYYVNEVKDSTKTVRLIPFIFNSDQTYVLEFGEYYMRVIRNGATVEVSGVSAWSGATAYTISDLVVEGGVNYYCILGHTNQQPPNATYWYPLTGDIYEIPTPYAEADLSTLNYDQSADVVTLTHPTYAVRELTREGHTDWTLSLITFAPTTTAPTNVAVSGTAGSNSFTYHVTAIDDDTFEESLAGTETQGSLTNPATNAHTITWDAVSGASNYNVYLVYNGIPGLVGIAGTNSFTNIINPVDADSTNTPPTARNPFSTTDDYPSCSSYYQQRHLYGNTNNNPETIETSQTGNYKNMSRSNPLQADDALTFTLASNQVNEIKNIITLGKLVVMTSGGEWYIKGDDAGTLTPTDINAEQISYYGSASLRPLIIGNSALFVQARNNIIRDLFNDAIESWSSDDLTIFSSHLFDGYTISDWTFQQVPNSIAWCVRSDGTLLGFTYVRRQKVFSWHRHDTEGTFENVCVVPEGNEDRLYAVIKRTIDGSTVRYIERMESREITNIEDLILMDSALTYDGRHTGSITMTLSGGTNWDYTETLTLTASSSYFVAGDVDKEIHLTGTDGTKVRFRIEAYSGVTVVTGKIQGEDVPASMQAVAISTWGKAVNAVSGLGHLEGESVSVFGDGFVEASPNNASYDDIMVSSAVATLSNYYQVIHVGLPYTSDLETLDIDTTQGETLADKQKLINKLHCYVEKSRGGFYGTKPPSDDTTDPIENLFELKQSDEADIEDVTSLATGIVEIGGLSSTWNNNGRVFIRQVDPLPLTLLAVVPSGYIPFRG